MREIKFRVPVYSFKTGEFLRFEYWKARSMAFTLPYGNKSNDEVYKDDEQFIGLRDKNGREIYEGDILLGTYGIGEVQYRNHEFVLFRHGDKEMFWSNCNEVIGNIHEPE